MSDENLPINIDEQLEKEARNVGKTIEKSSSFIKLDMRGGSFFNIPGIGEVEAPMEVVVVDYVARNGMYPPFEDDEAYEPYCWATTREIATMAPSDNVTNKQAESCNVCPNNMWGTRGKGKACKNQRILAILPPDADGSEDIRYITVSPAGIKSFDTFASSVAARFKKPPVGAIVEISIVPAGRSWTVSFSKTFKPNPKYKEHAMRRAEAENVFFDDNLNPSATKETPPEPTGKKSTRTRASRA